MPATKITELTAISTVNTTVDPLAIVDVSDTTQASSGTTKKITISQISTAIKANEPSIYSGATVNPNGVVTAPTGSIYFDISNPATPVQWVRTSTAWEPYYDYNQLTNTIVVDNVAALKALTVASLSNGQVILTRGYYTTNDGGQGAYTYNSSSSASDNGGTVIAPTSGSGRFLLQVSEYVNVKQFGAKGDFNHSTNTGTDDSVRIQAAINCGKALLFPSGNYLASGLTVAVPSLCLRGIKANGLYGNIGVTIKTLSKTTNLFTVSTYGLRVYDILFVGGSSDSQFGNDATNSAFVFQGSSQKDIDAYLHNCEFYLWNSCVKANGTNVDFDSCLFEASQYAFKSMSGSSTGWENRGFLFKSCRFHSIGRLGDSAWSVNCDPTHDVQDVSISGTTLCDVSVGLFNGFASGLLIDGVQITKTKGTGINLNSTGHTIDVRRRVALISNLSFYTHEDYTSLANNCIIASGVMSLSIDGVIANNIGGHGIVCSVDNASLKNIVINDAGMSANNTYDGIYISRDSSPFYLSNITVTQDKSYITRTNKARYGINYQSSGVSNSVFVSTSFATGKINKAAGVVISRDSIEVGSFTPTVSGNSVSGTASYAVRKGRYVRIGDIVECQIHLDWSAGTGSGNLIIEGLPFTSNNDTPAMFPIMTSGITISSGRYPVGFISTSQNEIWAQQSPAGGASTGIVSLAYASSGVMYITFSYSV